MPRRTLASLVLVALLLLLIVVAPAAVKAGGGCHGPDGSTYMEGSSTVVRMDVCSFAPTVARVPVGTEVRFLNTATVDHMVTGRSGTWGSDMLRPGAEFAETFTAAGTYPFSCPLHPGMVGAIVVSEGVAAGAAKVEAATTGSVASPAPDAAAAVPATDADWAPIGIAALAGIGAGAIATTFLGGVLVNRRRSAPAPTD
jgi:plastocyanin